MVKTFAVCIDTRAGKQTGNTTKLQLCYSLSRNLTEEEITRKLIQVHPTLIYSFRAYTNNAKSENS